MLRCCFAGGGLRAEGPGSRVSGFRAEFGA